MSKSKNASQYQQDIYTVHVNRKSKLERPQSRSRWLLLIYSFQFRSAFRASTSPSPTLVAVTDTRYRHYRRRQDRQTDRQRSDTIQREPFYKRSPKNSDFY